MPAVIIYDDPKVRFKTYCDVLFGPGVVGPPNGIYGQPGFSLVFGAGVSQAIKDQVQALADSPAVWGGWTPLPVPDIAGFRHDVITDPSASQYPLALLMAVLVSDPSLNYADRKAFAVHCQGWITTSYPTAATAILTALNNYAVNRNLPLT